MNMKESLFLPLLATAVLLAGCAAQPAAEEPASESEIAAILPVAESAAPQQLRLNVPDASVSGIVYADGGFTVQSAGAYVVSGALEGRLTVDADGPVELILEGAEITGPEAICILSDDPVTITADKHTVNTIRDGAAEPDENASAAIYSKAPLILRGDGSLRVEAGANNGIQSRSDLTVEGGDIAVTAAKNALKAKGDLTVSGGALSLTSGGDGLAAENPRLNAGSVAVSGGDIVITAGGRGIDAEGMARVTGGSLSVTSANDAIRGDTVDISGGTLSLTAECDGIQAETLLSVSGGEIAVVTAGGGGGAINKSGDNFGPMGGWGQETELENSAKGLKCAGNIAVSGGVIDLNTADDAVHAGVLCSIDGGELNICASDDALHADDMLVINDGFVNITDCFEGLEAFAIEVNGGTVVIRAVNDGINANGSEMMGWGRSSEEAEITSLSGAATTYYLQTGGTVDLVVTGSWNNVGDGIDSNGYVYITGGVLTVSTFGNTQEGGIDTGRDGPVVTGGMVMAGGASMMQESWSSESTQCCAVLSVDLQPGGTPVTIYDADGNEIWSVTLANTFNCLTLSHPAMTVGNVYTVDYGGGTETLDFTSTNIIRTGGWGMGGFGFRPF